MAKSLYGGKMAGEAFEYGWCHTDHKDGLKINDRWREEDYVFGATHGRSVRDALARLGLPMPEKEQVFRGTRHDLLFLNSHGVVARIGPTDLDTLTHPGILQPLGWADTNDADVKVVLYPGIEQYLQAFPDRNQEKAGLLRKFMESTQQSIGDLSSENLGVVRVQKDGREEIVPVVLDIDHHFNGASSKMALEKRRADALSQSREDDTRPRQIERMMSSVASTQSFGEILQEAFYVHQPLRNLFWRAYGPDGRPDRAALQNFWDRCARILKKPERFIVHGWSQRRNQHGIEVWVKDEKLVENMTLYRPWTKAADDQHVKRSGAMRDWESYVAGIKKDARHFATLPASVQLDKNFILNAFRENKDIGLLIAQDYRDDRAFMMQLADISLLGMLACAPEDLRADEKFMLPLIKQDEKAFIFCASSLKKDEAFVVECLSENEEVVEHLGDEFLNNRAFAEEWIEYLPHIYRYLNEDLQNDTTIARKAVLAYRSNFYYLPIRIRRNGDFVNEIMEVVPQLYSKLPFSTRGRADIALKALKYDSFYYRHVPDNLANDVEFSKRVLRENADCYGEMDREMRDNKEVTLEAIAQMAAQGKMQWARMIGDKALEDKDVVRAIVRDIPSALNATLFDRIELFDDVSFLIGMIKETRLPLRHIPHERCLSDDFIKGLDFIKYSPMGDGEIVEFFDRRWTVADKIGHPCLQDEDFILGNAEYIIEFYEFLPVTLRAKPEIARVAYKDSKNTDFMPDSLMDSEDFIMSMASERPDIIENASARLLGNTDFLKKFMAINVDSFFFLPREMFDQKENVMELIEQAIKQRRMEHLKYIPNRHKGDRDIAMAIVKLAPEMVGRLSLDISHFERDEFLLDAVRDGYLRREHIPRYKMDSESFKAALAQITEKAQKAHQYRQDALERFQARARYNNPHKF